MNTAGCTDRHQGRISQTCARGVQLVANLQFSLQLALITGLGLGGSAYAWVTGTALASATHRASGCASRIARRVTC
jgi:hypothetical protein